MYWTFYPKTYRMYYCLHWKIALIHSIISLSYGQVTRVTHVTNQRLTFPLTASGTQNMIHRNTLTSRKMCVCVTSVCSLEIVERCLQKVDVKDCMNVKTNVMRLGCHGNVISQWRSLIINLPARLPVWHCLWHPRLSERRTHMERFESSATWPATHVFSSNVSHSLKPGLFTAPLHTATW